jgi:protein O-mannosyl-transferase
VKTKSRPQVSRTFWWPAAAIIISAVLAFWPALSAGFIWDDDSMLTQNALIRGPLKQFWFSTEPVDYFPLTYTSLWLEWRLWGENALGYHVTNICLHALSCVFLWRAFERLKFPGAWLAALLFAVHPVNVESVAWIAERKNVLAMFFFALTAWSFATFAQTGNKRAYIISISAFLLSLLSKPAAMAWPLVAFAILWFYRGWHSSPKQTESAKPTFAKIVAQVGPFFALAVALSAVTVWFQHNRAIGTDTINHHGVVTRIAVASTSIWFYLGKALVPYPLSFVYSQWNVAVGNWLWIAAAVGLVGWFVAAWSFRKDKWGLSALLALGYFVVMLAPVLGFVNIYFHRYSYVADHWQYFALPAVTVMVSALLAHFKLKPVALVLAAIFAVISFAHSRVFHDQEILWTDTLEKNPKCWLAMNNLGFGWQNSGRVDDAFAIFSRSLEIHPEQPEAHNNRGFIYLSAGKLDQAAEEFSAAIRINPRYAPAHNNLASVCSQKADFDRAIEALRCKGDYQSAYNNLGCLMSMRGNHAEAIELIRKALAIQPDYSDALVNLGALLNDEGNQKEAVPVLEKAIKLAPENPDGYSNLGNALMALNQVDAARARYNESLHLRPSHHLAQFGLANCLLKTGQVDEALKIYQGVVEAHPEHAESHYQLATIYASRHERNKATAQFREAVRLKPDWVPALNNLAWELATDEHCSAVDSAQAVRLAQHAVELTHGRDASSLDTLAAAWARSEVFGKATDLAKDALNAAIGSGRTNIVSDIQKRLALYQGRKAYSEQ